MNKSIVCLWHLPYYLNSSFVAFLVLVQIVHINAMNDQLTKIEIYFSFQNYMLDCIDKWNFPVVSPSIWIELKIERKLKNQFSFWKIFVFYLLQFLIPITFPNWPSVWMLSSWTKNDWNVHVCSIDFYVFFLP